MEDKDLLRMYGQRIYKLRTERNLSQTELADLVDMEKGSISRLEAGTENSKLTTLHKIATALGVTLPELLDFPPATKTKKK